MAGSDDEDNWSIPSDFDGNMTAKAIENQQLGFKLAGEIRRLRESLNYEKQQRRLLLVNHQSLEEQLHRFEGQNQKLEHALRLTDDQRKKLQRSLEDEKLHCALVSEELRILQSTLKVDRNVVSQQQEQITSMTSKIQQLQQEVRRLQDYGRALELAVNELGQQHRAAGHRKAEIHYESTLLTEGLEVLLQRWRIMLKDQQPSISITAGVSGGARLKEMERLLSTTFLKIEWHEQQLTKEKAHVKQLLKVVAMYESMVPLAGNMDNHTSSNETKRVGRSKHPKKVTGAYDDDEDLDD